MMRLLAIVAKPAIAPVVVKVEAVEVNVDREQKTHHLLAPAQQPEATNELI
jgi:hypothetical protein